ncbi:FAD-dependent oxidoreductase [Jiangella endophytica]|uniref:FAD-dependent oxidoreductase n=1 Tax=Jiangella endophytica TaxID=1623398 RepID=UPI0018E51951|nr:FAD-dependent oxidoreductase [Jiangella endophytica]
MISARCAVVGAGLAGASATWRLAASGVETVLLEARTPAHDGGSSHGSARIFRHAYPDPEYVALTVRALAGWRELSAAAGAGLLRTTGGLDTGAGRDLPAIAAALDTAGLEYELLPAAAAGERWPQLAFGTDVLYQPGAGVVDAAAAVTAMVSLAGAAGAQVRTGWRLAGLERRGGGAGWRLTPRDGGEPVECELLVLCAGPWLPELVRAAELAPVRAALPDLRVTQQSVVHFPFPGDAPADWPVWVHKDELDVYALPGGRDAGHHGFKIAEHDAGRPVTATTRDGVVDPAARRRLVDYVRRFLPGVPPEPYAATTCLYTSTPDADFVLDRVGDVVMVSACSGHGAKFAPLVGELAADLAAGRDTPRRFRRLGSPP